MFEDLLKKAGKMAFLALQLVAVVTVLTMIFGSISDRSFSLAYVFPGNYIVSAAVVAVGLLLWFMPTRLAVKMKKSKLVDHSTIGEVMREERKKKQDKGFEILILGIFAAIIAAILELILWLII